MNSSSKSVTACGLCHHYNPEGRRDGFCQRLDVHVRSSWDACILAVDPFDSSCQLGKELDSLALKQKIEATQRNEMKARDKSYV